MPMVKKMQVSSIKIQTIVFTRPFRYSESLPLIHKVNERGVTGNIYSYCPLYLQFLSCFIIFRCHTVTTPPIKYAELAMNNVNSEVEYRRWWPKSVLLSFVNNSSIRLA